MADASSAKRVFLSQAQKILEYVEVVSDKSSPMAEIEKMRMSLELVKHNRVLMDELLQRFVDKVRTRLAGVDRGDRFVVTQDVVNDITGSERIRICAARITPELSASVLQCVKQMDSLVYVMQQQQQPVCA
jgi:hypothetical protein